MTEKSGIVKASITDAFFGTTGIKSGFRILLYLNRQKSPDAKSAREMVSNLKEKLGSMYAIARLIHYRRNYRRK